MSRPQEADRNQDATCYVGNLDERATDALVWELMLQAGPIVNVHLPKDRITSAHQGYAFAEFQTENDAEYACRIMNGIKLFGKPLRVNKASSDRKQIDIGANLFVGNLDSNVDERTLYGAFGAFGAIVGLPKIARDPVTNASKSYGFVSYDSFEAADAAIESLNNQFLLNRPITVSYALKKDGKGGERHGTAAERLLAAQARKNNALPPRAAPPAFFGPPPTGRGVAGVAGQGVGVVAPPPPPGPPPPGSANGGVAPGGWGSMPIAPPAPPGTVVPPPPPVGFSTSVVQPPPPLPPQGYPSGPPPAVGAIPPPPLPHGMPYGGPPPPMAYGVSPRPPSFMTGSNNAPLGSR